MYTFDKDVQLLTPLLIDEYASMLTLPGERDYRAIREKKLRNKLVTGSFNGVNFAHILVKSTGDKYRANGQHCSKMLQKYLREGGKLPDNLKATIEVWTVENELELSQYATYIFGTYDNKDSSRTESETAAATVRNNPTVGLIFKSIPKNIIKSMANGVYRSTVTPGTKKVRVSAEHKAKGLLSASAASFCATFANLITDRQFQSQAVISAMYSSYKQNNSQSVTFWADVVTTKTARSIHAENLRTFLLKSNSSSSENDQNRVERMCFKYWGDYVRSSTDVG